MNAPGILNLYKPPGISSNYFLSRIKSYLPKDSQKLGHFGTLDPMAAGVLLVGLNGAARLNSFLSDFPKTYIAVGITTGSTPTGDATEAIDEFTEPDAISKYFTASPTDKQKILDKYKIEYWQAPPLYSAAKFKGQKLYVWARRGKPVYKEKKKRNIYKFEILKERSPYILFKAEVSSGTYIRTLFQDYCSEWGMKGHLVSLLRTEIGPFSIHNSTRFYQLKQGKFAFLNPLDFLPFNKFTVDEGQKERFIHGAYLFDRFAISDYVADQYLWAVDAQGQSLGLGQHGEYLGKKVLKPIITWPFVTP